MCTAAALFRIASSWLECWRWHGKIAVDLKHADHQLKQTSGAQLSSSMCQLKPAKASLALQEGLAYRTTPSGFLFRQCIIKELCNGMLLQAAHLFAKSDLAPCIQSRKAFGLTQLVCCQGIVMQ